jgi:hypothetical protein
MDPPPGKNHEIGKSAASIDADPDVVHFGLVAGAAGGARARGATAPGGFEPAPAAADPEGGNELADLAPAAGRAPDIGFAADPGQGLETAAAVVAEEFIERHEPIL